MAKLKHPYTLVVVGPPGSGKGTQAAKLAESLGWPHIDVGDLLREAARGQDATAHEIKTTMQQGKMLPSELVKPIVAQALGHCQNGVVLDGYARQVDQVDTLIDWAEAGTIPPLWGVQLDVPAADIIGRIKQRRYCSGCRHKQYLVTDVDQAVSCLRCGGHLMRRSDDQESTVKTRLATFAEQTVPAIKRLGSKARLTVIDGQGTIDEVAARVLKEVTTS